MSERTERSARGEQSKLVERTDISERIEWSEIYTRNFRNDNLYIERSKKEIDEDPWREIENLVDKIFKRHGIEKSYWNIRPKEYREIIQYR